MKDDTTITPLHQPGTILDPLTEIAREGARQMLRDRATDVPAEKKIRFWERLFRELSTDPDFEHVLIDSATATASCAGVSVVCSL